MQPLYFQPAPVVFEKNASEVTLPENANLWPNEIMQELYKQVPYIADFDPEVIMDRVDAERAYGFGHVEVKNKSELQNGASEQTLAAVGVQQARIPVIIKNRKLYPFDVVITADSKVLPLTEGRLRQALFRPQAFDVTGKTPGDLSMIGQLYPPVRVGGMGIAGGVGGDMSTKLSSALEDFLAKESEKKCPKCGSMEKCSCWGKKMASADGAGDLDKLAREGTGQSAGTAVGGAIGAVGGHRLGKMLAGSAEANSKGNWKQRLGARAVRAAATVGGLGAGSALGGSAGKNIEFTARHVGKQERALRREYERAQEKQGSLLAAILPTINPDDHIKFASALEEPGLQARYLKNSAATSPALLKLSEYDPVSNEKVASVIERAVRPNVVQVSRSEEGYRVKSANTDYWSPKTEYLDRGQVTRMVGAKVVLAADMSGSVTIGPDAGVSEAGSPESKPEIVSSFGLYRVKDDKGQELVGFVFPNLLDLDGTALPVALFSNGSATAMQESIAGELVGKDSGLVFGPASGHGMFVRQLPNGGVDAMIPMTIKAGYSEGGAHKMHVETFDGREVFIEVQPNIKNPLDVDGSCIIPDTFRWMPLGGDDVSLVEHPEDWGQSKAASRAFSSVVVRSGGDNSFSFAGIPVEKLSSADKQFLSLDDAMFLLTGLGTDLDYASEKLAESMALSAPVTVRIGRQIKMAQEQRAQATKTASSRFVGMPNLRRNLIKEAAFVPDPLAVDTVLSVGFINPENITTFISYLPEMDASQERLCELLVASRLGLSDVPSSPLEKSIKSLEEVLEGLRVLAFQKS